MPCHQPAGERKLSTRPTFQPPQTLVQAKRSYAKCGPRLSSQEQRQLARGAELFRRAEKIQDAERRRRQNIQRRRERAEREREARRRAGLWEQRPWISQRQAFLDRYVTAKEESVVPRLGKADITRSEENEDPWQEDVLDDVTLLNTINSAARTSVHDNYHPQPTKDHPSSHDSVDSPAALRMDLEEAWADLLVSNTQLERELSPSGASLRKSLRATPTPRDQDIGLAFVSTQDITFSEDDLAELGIVLEQRPGLEITEKSSVDSTPKRIIESSLYPVAAHGSHGSEDTRHRLDRLMMPPPSRPKPMALIASNTCLYSSSTMEPLAAEFDLSSQDLREIYA